MKSGGDNINPLALLFLAAMCLMTLYASRKNAVRSVLVTAAFVPLGQQIVVLGLHFYFLRILILVCLGRLLVRGESATFKTIGVDKFFLGWVSAGLICGVLRGPSAETFGAVYNAIGVYFFFRILIRDPEDVLDQLRLLAGVSIAIGVCMAWESVMHRNPFYVLGGVQEFGEIRDGRFRCQGPFRHPILAGTFGATLFPLMVGLWFQDWRSKRLALLGSIASMIIAVTSASSGAFLTLIAAVFGFALWPMRQRMHLFRWSVVAAIIGLALVMEAPVWYLISKVSDFVGGGGWHRSYLIDQFIRHFNEWWLIGTGYTAHWAPSGQVLAVDPNNMDITNHYVAQGVGGGLLGLSLFLSIIISCFKIIGRSVRVAGDLPFDRKLLWAFGVALASHCAAFISISYFDQITVFWYWLLAGIVTVGMETQRKAAAHGNREPIAVEEKKERPSQLIVANERERNAADEDCPQSSASCLWSSASSIHQRLKRARQFEQHLVHKLNARGCLEWSGQNYWSRMFPTRIVFRREARRGDLQWQPCVMQSKAAL